MARYVVYDPSGGPIPTLTVGKRYKILAARHPEVFIENDNGFESWYHVSSFWYPLGAFEGATTEEQHDCTKYTRADGEPPPTVQPPVKFVFTPRPRTASHINDLVDLCHTASVDAGWWPATVRRNPMVFAQKLMLIVSELAEAMEGDRKELPDDKLPTRSMREVELADALIRICDLAGAFDMDLGGAVVEKLEYNRNREDHKPGARAGAGGKKY